jgi:hypothetical protein
MDDGSENSKVRSKDTKVTASGIEQIVAQIMNDVLGNDYNQGQMTRK